MILILLIQKEIAMAKGKYLRRTLNYYRAGFDCGILLIYEF